MKELVSVHDFLVVESEMGDWDGEEQLAADNINRILHKIYELADDDVSPSVLEQHLSSVWGHWCDQPELTSLDEYEIEAFATWLLNQDEELEMWDE